MALLYELRGSVGVVPMQYISIGVMIFFIYIYHFGPFILHVSPLGCRMVFRMIGTIMGMLHNIHAGCFGGIAC